MPEQEKPTRGADPRTTPTRGADLRTTPTRGADPRTTDARPLANRAVAVFGSSEPQPGEPAYEDARHLGGLLAKAGARVVSGGYGGVMEAVSRGAREAGGSATGVAGTFFADREPNRWLDDVHWGEDLFERTRLLIDLSEAFIILPGKSGTIAELAFVWALDRAGLFGPRPLVLCGAIWPDLLAAFERAGVIEPAQRAMTLLAPAVPQAVDVLIATMGAAVDARKESKPR